MKTVITLFQSISFCLFSSFLFAAPDLAELQAMYPAANEDEWNYSVEIKDDTGLRLERFQDGVWSLLRFDNQKPDASHLKRYQEYLHDQEAQEERTTPVYFIGRLINALSKITVLEESENSVVYGVDSQELNNDPQDDMHKYMQARLYFDPVKRNIARLTLESTEPFSAQAMVKVHSLKVEADIGDGNANVPKGFLQEQRTTMKGRLMGLKKIEQQEFYRYFEFEQSKGKVEEIPVEADGGIGDGADPLPMAD